MPFDLVTPLPAILPKKIIKDMGEITENTHTHTHTEHKIHLVKIKKKYPAFIMYLVFALGTQLSTLCMLSYLILKTNLWITYYYYHHHLHLNFTGKN